MMNKVRGSLYDFSQFVHHYEAVDCELMTESCDDFDSCSLCLSSGSLLAFLVEVVSVKYASCSTLSINCHFSVLLLPLQKPAHPGCKAAHSFLSFTSFLAWW